MSIINELVYNRTQADVDRVYTLKNKILTGGLAALTAEEKAEYLTGMKGAYNYTDFNRLGEAITYLVEQMKKLDIHDSSIVPKVDWVMGDTPTQSQVRNLLNCLTKLRAKLSLPDNTPSVPNSLDKLTYQTANDMEFLLWIIDQRIMQTTTAFRYSGTMYCGQ